MNKSKREEIKKIIDVLALVNRNLENIKFSEEASFDNLPENLQGSIKGETFEENIDILESAIDNLTEAITDLEELL